MCYTYFGPDRPMAKKLRCRDGIKCPITGCIDLERLRDEIEPEVDEDLLDFIEVRYFINIPPSTLTSDLKFAYDTLWAWANLTDDD
ncbi:hypothetical protein CPC08DRAFT_824090 [Agrocybe pediades]|nr:hypothetical protein CPC08DRAFT_824090 [Agrocybe pediades]